MRSWITLFVVAVMAPITVTRAFVVPSLSSSSSLTSPPRQASHVLLASATSTAATVELPAGLTKTIVQQGEESFPLQRGDIATLKYACYVVNGHNNNDEATNDKMTAPFAKATRQKMVIGEGTMIAAWESALRGMRIGERAIFRVSDPALGYGAAGVPPVVPSNAVLELDVHVLDAQPPTANIDFDNLALDATPTTATDIARAYEIRQAAKGENEELQGLQGFIQKAKNFYFFGLFEGETGERPPWFLRPSITFPLAFVIVGAAFYVTFVGGGITERGAQTTDELDEIILSSSSVAQWAVVNALALTQGVTLGL